MATHAYYNEAFMTAPSSNSSLLAQTLQRLGYNLKNIGLKLKTLIMKYWYNYLMRIQTRYTNQYKILNWL